MVNSKVTFGNRGIIPTKAEESRTIPFVVSTNTRDRHHTVTNSAGWKLDNYRKNPIVGYMHAPADGFISPDPDYVIGHDLDSKVEGRNLSGLLKFDPADINLLAERIFRKVLFGSMRACSAYFLELGIGKYGTGEEAKGREKETYYYSGQELLEWSIVNIPSNPDAGKRSFGHLRANSQAALVYTMRQLGKKFSLNQIENMRICDILNLLEGKDLEIKSTDPRKVGKMINEQMAEKDIIELIEKQQRELKLIISQNRN